MRITIELSRPPRRLAAIALAILLVALPSVAVASHLFSDVPTSHPFHADITALTAKGVTGGCGGGKYCPDGYVTRAQMAAFLNRLGALAPGKTPVVNADRLDGLDSSAFATDFGTEANPGWGTGFSDCMVGEIRLAAANWSYTRPADGSILPIEDHEPLFALIGTLYGGDGETTFALPDLREVTPQSANGQPLVYSICVTGIYPSRE
jgi:hypothetical protein